MKELLNTIEKYTEYISVINKALKDCIEEIKKLDSVYERDVNKPVSDSANELADNSNTSK